MTHPPTSAERAGQTLRFVDHEPRMLAQYRRDVGGKAREVAGIFQIQLGKVGKRQPCERGLSDLTSALNRHCREHPNEPPESRLSDPTMQEHA